MVRDQFIKAPTELLKPTNYELVHWYFESHLLDR